MGKEQRVEFIDFFRGIGILLMVINHVYFGGVFYNFTHAFHMPMFFIISGFLYSKKSPEQLSTSVFLMKKAKSLLLPYCVFGLIHYLIWIAIYGLSLEPLTKLFFFNTEDGMPIAGALWFLTALFITDVVFFILDRYINNRIVFITTIIILSLFGTVARLLLPFTLPFGMSAGFVGLGLFGIGILLKRASKSKVYIRFDEIGLLPKALFILALGALTCILIFLNGAVNMRDGKYAIIPLFWINATLATVMGFLLSKEWVQHIRIKLVNGYICSIGRESIVYLCLNQLVIFFVKAGFESISLPFILQQIIVLVITLVILYLLCRVIFKTKIKYVFGK